MLGLHRIHVLTLIALQHQLPRQVIAIPRRTEQGVRVDDTIYSSPELNYTHDICYWLYRSWAGTSLPRRVASENAIANQRTARISFYCVDNRRKAEVEQAIATTGEVRQTGPYHLQCNSDTEIATTYSGTNAALNYKPFVGSKRTFGRCVPKSDTSSSGDDSEDTSVRAGEVACLSVEAQEHFSEINAWTEQTGGVGGSSSNWNYDSGTSWMSLTEINTDRTITVSNKNHIEMPVDHAKGKSSIYRACARREAGHGNAVLRVSVRS